MKTITTLLISAFVIISLCLGYLIKKGVSIRTAPIIKPSIISPTFENVGPNLFLRLFPDFQQAHYILWGLPQNSPEAQKTLQMLKKLYEKQFKNPLHIIEDGPQATEKDLVDCTQPCWIFFKDANIHSLSANTWLEKNLNILGPNYFTLNWISFHRKVEVPNYCIEEKRLDFECLKLTSVKNVERKLHNLQQRYFFMMKYLDHDYFLFIEDTHSAL